MTAQFVLVTRAALARLMFCMAMVLMLTQQAQLAGAAELVLANKGKSLAPIVIYEGAPPLTREAADQLAQYIERVTGALPVVIEGLPDPMPARAIWVGYQPALKALFPDVDFDFKHPEEILIAANDQHLVIAGRDVWSKQGQEVVNRTGTFTGIQQEYGTANAVYTFIQDYMDVRWLWPGELGTDVIKKETLAFLPFVFRYHPQVRSRGGILNYSRITQNRNTGISSEWSRFQRLQLDSMNVPDSHAFDKWWDLYHESNPDYFALQPDGTRGLVTSPRTQKVCMSNPAVWDRWLLGVEQQLKEDPNKVVFSAADSDGWATGHCICENCEAWDHPDGEKRRFNWKGLAGEHVALSDRHVTFANTLARMLKKRYPDKDYLVATLTYGHSLPAPIKARPDENVVVFSTGNFLGRQQYRDETSPDAPLRRELFANWAKVSHHIMWRPNTGSPAGWKQAFPDVSLNETIENLKFMGENGFVGFFIDMVWEHWATQGPMYYIMAHMTWDPSKDGHTILDDYYQRAYGPAAAPMKQYWQLMDQTRTQYTEKFGYRELDMLPEFYVQPMVEAQKLMDNADALAADGPEVYRQRLAFTRMGLTWTLLGLENMRFVAQVRASKQKDHPAIAHVKTNWDKMRQIATSEQYPQAINAAPTRSQTKHMSDMQLEPDSK